MALAVIGGLVFSTVLSLLFVPAMFLVMDDVGSLFARLGRKLIVSSGEAADEPQTGHAAHSGHEQKPPPSVISPAAE
jgi:hypothetical protein